MFIGINKRTQKKNTEAAKENRAGSDKELCSEIK
jgi:hypothetical protein